MTDAALGVPATANVDGLAVVDATHFYLSFADDTTLTPSSGPSLTVQDEDVVYWNGSAWSVYFDGTAHGLTTNALDVNAISVRSGVLYFATFGSANPPGDHRNAGRRRPLQLERHGYARVFDASAHGIPAKARVDGAVRFDATHYYLSFSTNTSLRGFGSVQDEDIVALDTTGTRARQVDDVVQRHGTRPDDREPQHRCLLAAGPDRGHGAMTGQHGDGTSRRHHRTFDAGNAMTHTDEAGPVQGTDPRARHRGSRPRGSTGAGCSGWPAVPPWSPARAPGPAGCSTPSRWRRPVPLPPRTST